MPLQRHCAYADSNIITQDKKAGIFMKTRNVAIDILKLLSVFLVVAIHYSTLLPRETIVPFARFAVPLFFMFSGFFVAISKKENLAKAKDYIVASLKYLLFAMAIVMLFGVVLAIIDGKSIQPVIESFFPANIIKDFLFYNRSTGAHSFHLWFLIAMFVVSLIHYVFCKTNKTKWYLPIAITLLIVALVLGNYSGMLGLGKFSLDFSRNAIFTGFPFFAIGFYFGKKDFQIKNIWRYIILLAGVGLTFCQILEFRLFKADWATGDLFVCTILATIALFVFATTSKVRLNMKYISNKLVFNVYIAHILVGTVLYRLFTIGKEMAIICFFASLILCEFLYLLKLLIKKLCKKLPKKEEPLPINEEQQPADSA